jgi:hypothetical protein
MRSSEAAVLAGILDDAYSADVPPAASRSDRDSIEVSMRS